MASDDHTAGGQDQSRNNVSRRTLLLSTATAAVGGLLARPAIDAGLQWISGGQGANFQRFASSSVRKVWSSNNFGLITTNAPNGSVNSVAGALQMGGSVRAEQRPFVAIPQNRALLYRVSLHRTQGLETGGTWITFSPPGPRNSEPLLAPLIAVSVELGPQGLSVTGTNARILDAEAEPLFDFEEIHPTVPDRVELIVAVDRDTMTMNADGNPLVVVEPIAGQLPSLTGSPLWYRAGILNSNGSIQATEQFAALMGNPLAMSVVNEVGQVSLRADAFEVPDYAVDLVWSGARATDLLPARFLEQSRSF